MRATIIANGNLAHSKIELNEAEILIAANGGGRHCLKMGLNPKVVIGDFDSLTENELAELDSRGAALIRYPADKDETDLELALNYALEQGASEIWLYGLLGGRWDMTISNLILLAAPRFDGVSFRVIDKNTEILILRTSSLTTKAVCFYLILDYLHSKTSHNRVRHCTKVLKLSIHSIRHQSLELKSLKPPRNVIYILFVLFCILLFLESHLLKDYKIENSDR